MRFFVSLFAVCLLASPVLAGGYGVQQQRFFVPRQQFAPAYVPQQQVIQKQVIVRQQAVYAPAVQAAPAFDYCAPAVQAAPAFYAPVQQAPRGFLPGRGLFGGGKSTFRQRTFFRGNGAAPVQAQFSTGGY